MRTASLAWPVLQDGDRRILRGRSVASCKVHSWRSHTVCNVLEDTALRGVLSIFLLRALAVATPVPETSCGLLAVDPNMAKTLTVCDRSLLMIDLSKYVSYIFIMSWDSAVGIATDYGLDGRGVGVRVLVGARIFYSPRRPDRFWSPFSLLSNG
jgi:hypothetical protein